MRAIIETMGPVPEEIRRACAAYCDASLIGMNTITDEDDRCELAERLLAGFARTCHPQAIGLDAISVAIVSDDGPTERDNLLFEIERMADRISSAAWTLRTDPECPGDLLEIVRIAGMIRGIRSVINDMLPSGVLDEDEESE